RQAGNPHRRPRPWHSRQRTRARLRKILSPPGGEGARALHRPATAHPARDSARAWRRRRHPARTRLRILYYHSSAIMNTGRILVVDDEPQIRRVLRASLSTQGYEIHEARTGEEALTAVRAQRFDLILLDM